MENRLQTIFPLNKRRDYICYIHIKWYAQSWQIDNSHLELYLAPLTVKKSFLEWMTSTVKRKEIIMWLKIAINLEVPERMDHRNCKVIISRFFPKSEKSTARSVKMI